MADVANIIATAFLLRSPAKIDTIVLDASVTETHTMEVDVTDHPVEQGAPVTDHARPKPITLSMEGIISNTPLSRTQQLRMVTSLGITFQTTAEAEHILGAPGYGEQAYMAMQAIRDAAKLITVVTSLRTYENMEMTSLVVPRNKDVGECFRFTAQFKEIRIVENKLTAAKKTVAPKKVSTGKQTPNKAGKGTKGSSILYDATYGDGIKNAFNNFGKILSGGGQ